MIDVLKHASIAWNPVGATRKHLNENTLSPSKIIVTYLAIVVGCNMGTVVMLSLGIIFLVGPSMSM